MLNYKKNKEFNENHQHANLVIPKEKFSSVEKTCSIDHIISDINVFVSDKDMNMKLLALALLITVRFLIRPTKGWDGNSADVFTLNKSNFKLVTNGIVIKCKYGSGYDYQIEFMVNNFRMICGRVTCC